MEQYDVIVVGAGIVGSWTAYILASRGVKVLLLDQFPLPHSRGSSHGQSRGIRLSYANPAETALAQASYPYWEKLEQQAGDKILLKCNLLDVAGPTNYKTLNAKKESIRSVNPTGYRTLSPQELAREFPCFSFPSNYKGLIDYKAGVLRPDKSLKALHDMFRRMGGVLIDGYKVDSISAGPPVRVSGNKGVYLAQSLIVCAGAWTNDVLAHLNFNLPLQPQRVIAPYFRIKEGHSYPNITFVFNGDSNVENSHFYSIPSVDYPNMVKVANHGGIPVHPDLRDSVDVSILLKRNSDHVRTFWPCLHPEPAIVEYCIYTMTPDEQFILDQHPRYPHIAYACGFSGTGFKISPAVGEILSDLVMGRTPVLNYKPFTAKRFTSTSSKL